MIGLAGLAFAWFCFAKKPNFSKREALEGGSAMGMQNPAYAMSPGAGAGVVNEHYEQRPGSVKASWLYVAPCCTAFVFAWSWASATGSSIEAINTG